MSERYQALKFLNYYAGTNPKKLKALADRGRIVARCDCGDEICTGWQMAYPDDDVEGFPVAELIGGDSGA